MAFPKSSTRGYVDVSPSRQPLGKNKLSEIVSSYEQFVLEQQKSSNGSETLPLVVSSFDQPVSSIASDMITSSNSDSSFALVPSNSLLSARTFVPKQCNDMSTMVSMLRHQHRPKNTLHSGRVSGLTYAASSGVSIHDLAVQSGHRDVNALSSYIEV